MKGEVCNLMYAMGIMKTGMWRAMNRLKDKSSEWGLSGSRLWAAGRRVLRFTFPALAALRSLTKGALGIAAGVPLTLWLGAAALLAAGLWLQEHDAKVRAGAALEQSRQQSAQRIAALEAQASAALRQANERNAATITRLETRRAALARQAAELTTQLGALRKKNRAEQAEITTMPAEQVSERVRTMLGESSVISGPSSAVRGPSQGAMQADAKAVGAANEPAVGTPALQPASGERVTAVGTPPLQLTEEGQRQVLSALVERDACRDESSLLERQLANCNQRVAAGEAEIRTQADSLARLNAALGAKDKILAEREAQHRAELRAARGTWRRRAWRALKYVAAGLVMGVALR